MHAHVRTYIRATRASYSFAFCVTQEPRLSPKLISELSCLLQLRSERSRVGFRIFQEKCKCHASIRAHVKCKLDRENSWVARGFCPSLFFFLFSRSPSPTPLNHGIRVERRGEKFNCNRLCRRPRKDSDIRSFVTRIS